MGDNLDIMIADDHELVRDAIAHMLAEEPGLSVRTAADFGGVLEALDSGGKADIVLLDVNMPGMAGLESIRQVVRANSGGAVVVFSGSLDRDLVRQAIDSGARGYVPKSMPMKALASALRLVSVGQVFVPLALTLESRPLPHSSNLSEREMGVLRGVSRGRTNKEIALDLGLSEVTVKMHMRAVCSKLGAKNRTQAALIAQKKSLV